MPKVIDSIYIFWLFFLTPYLLFCFQAQTLASLKAWCQWLSQLHTVSLKDESYEPQCRDLTSRIMVAVAPVVKAGDSLELTHSAAHFMVTLTGTYKKP